MEWQSFLLMRHELVLIALILTVLVAEIFIDGPRKRLVLPLSLILFTLHTALGFLPSAQGALFGDMFVTSRLLTSMKNILNIGALIVLMQSIPWLMKEENNGKFTEYVLLMWSTLLGMYFLISSGHFLMFFIGIETATIPLAVLAAYDRHNNRSAEAGIKLIMMSALSTGISIYGISLIYGATGSMYFSAIASTIGNQPLEALGLVFFLAGMAFKISLVPFHFWAPDVYEGAPANVTSYLSVISKGAAVFILITLLFTVFHSIIPLWRDALVTLAIITMTVGNLFALRQQNLKRFLAYSSIAQAGFILLGIISGNELGMASVVYFILVYIFSNLGAFGVIVAISNATGKENMDDYNGLYRTNPRLSLAMMLSLFSLAGIPPVAGFFGKFFLFAAAAKEGYYLLVSVAVLNTIVSLYYYLLIVKAMFINQTDKPIAYFTTDFYTRVSLVLCMIGLIAAGLYSPVFEYIRDISFGI